MKISLPTSSVNLLRQIIATPGWAKGFDDIYIGGQLSAETIPAIKEPDFLLSADEVGKLPTKDAREYQDKCRAWNETLVEFEITDKQRETIKKAIKEACPKLSVETNMFRIMVALEIKE